MGEVRVVGTRCPVCHELTRALITSVSGETRRGQTVVTITYSHDGRVCGQTTRSSS